MSHNTKGYIVQEISRLKPGQEIIVSRQLLRDLEPANEFAAAVELLARVPSDPIDKIMGSVIGSSYNIVHSIDPKTRNVIFKRLENPLPDNLRTWVDPDRRHLYVAVGPYFRFQGFGKEYHRS